jgi:shikimate kinase
MRIYIIGMPGSGKTTVARTLAQTINYAYIDLDGMIEKNAHMFIEEIFEHYGEEKFRSLETEMLSSIKDENAVVSCGGGVVVKKRNKLLMDGVVIYLDVELDTIKNRLQNDFKRPLLLTKSIEDLFDERFLKYQDFASIIVSNNQDLMHTIESIINRLKEKKMI